MIYQGAMHPVEIWGLRIDFCLSEIAARNSLMARNASDAGTAGHEPSEPRRRVLPDGTVEERIETMAQLRQFFSDCK